MRLFNLTCLLLLVMGCAFPVAQWEFINIYHEIPVQLHSFTIFLLNPLITYVIFGILILRLWVYANFKERIAIRTESKAVLFATIFFFLVSLIGFLKPRLVIVEAPIGKYT